MDELILESTALTYRTGCWTRLVTTLEEVAFIHLALLFLKAVNEI